MMEALVNKAIPVMAVETAFLNSTAEVTAIPVQNTVPENTKTTIPNEEVVREA